MTLDGPQRRALREILDDAFNRADLRRALAESTPAHTLENLVRPGRFLDELAELIRTAEKKGWLEQFEDLLEQEVPGRTDLIERLRAVLEQARKKDAADVPDPSGISDHVQGLLEEGNLQTVARWAPRISRTGTFAEATAINERLIKLAGSNDKQLAARGYETLGDLYDRRGRSVEARKYWNRSLTRYRRLDDAERVAELKSKLGR